MQTVSDGERVFFCGLKVATKHMALSPLTESDIIDLVYTSYENDNDTWNSTSAEYLTARRFSKPAIMRWELLEGVDWNELHAFLTDAADGTKTTTAGTYTYTAPTNMRRPPRYDSYVRIKDSAGNSSYYLVVPLSKVEQLDRSSDKFVYFTGDQTIGYTMNVNPNVSLTTGDTIEYEYKKRATYFTTTTSSTEMSNPMYIVHMILYRLYKNDGLVSEAREELDNAESLLQEMKADQFSVIDDTQTGDPMGFGV